MNYKSLHTVKDIINTILYKTYKCGESSPDTNLYFGTKDLILEFCERRVRSPSWDEWMESWRHFSAAITVI